MDELPPDARAFLTVARAADDPSPEQRARSDQALRAMLSRRGIDGLPQLATGAATAGAGHFGFGPRAVLATKLSAGALALIAAAYFGVRSSRSEPAETPRARPTAARALAPELAPAPARESAPAARALAEAAREPEHRASTNAPLRADARRSPLRPASDALAVELRTVAAVDALVRQQHFSDALRMLDHTESESAAVLREERTALRILARCGIAPGARVLRERAHFLRASPRSVLAERVRNACAKSGVEQP